MVGRIIFVYVTPVLSIRLPVTSYVAGRLDGLKVDGGAGNCRFTFCTVGLCVAGPRVFGDLAGSMCPAVTSRFSAAPRTIRELVECSVRGAFRCKSVSRVCNLFNSSVDRGGNGIAGNYFVGAVTGVVVGGGHWWLLVPSSSYNLAILNFLIL